MFESALLIFIAEMADKTQFMVMALCTQYPSMIVAVGMALGAVVISFLSTGAAHLLTHFLPLVYLQAAASGLFLLFGFASLWMRKEKEQETKGKRRFPLISIAFGFVIAELGDKTQLSTIALAAHESQLAVFLGASLGLIAANLLAIFAGKLLLKKLDPRYLDLAGSILFLYFGFASFMELELMSESTSLLFLLLIVFLYWTSALHLLKRTDIS